ncbi:GFA family protein [Aliihoeflea aestuarii]|jgi:hypothetical protein|uniref:GFA family protein n=1 Tax=Aliihoeflea aestuarii TaxID=453840 RepID=UPI002092E3C2|nr:GFA family protein [Aliihoeflea aestuarii]MCO6389533.1 GFA family protein [Aliihoeflea aestuarii]
MRYMGGCHCGNIEIEIDGELTAALSCNCSICSKKGALLWAVPHDRLKVRAVEEPARYLFNNHVIVHRFCAKCGMHPYGEDAAEQPGRSAYVNIRCLEEVDLASVPRVEFDGRSIL